MKDLFEKCRKPSMVKELKEKGVYPYFHALETRQDAVVIMEGKRRIMLGSNNYLGLTVEPEVIEAGLKALEKYGTGMSGSRFLNGTLDMHLQLEAELAEFVHKDGCVTWSTGFQTNLGIISSIVGMHDYAVIDREAHASIYDGVKLSFGNMLRYKHADMEDLEKQLQKVPEKSGCLIITDGVFSMGGDIAKLPEICALAKKYGARVMVDDAHSFGVLGDGGRGTASYYGLEDQVDIIMSTFSKSLASLGGFMAASDEVVEYVKHNSRPFIFSASLPPANAASALAALHFIKNHPERQQRLLHLCKYFRDGLKAHDIPIIDGITPVVPIYTYEPYRTLSKVHEIYERGVYANQVLPPACAPGECLMRTSLMAILTEELLDEAIGIIADVLHED